MTKEDLLEAIQKFFGDKSRSREETKDGLEEAIAEIEMFLEAL